MAFGATGARGPRAEINVTPLVDVVLVLLIVFMVLARAEQRQLPVRVPASASPGAGAAPSQLVVRIAADGGLALGGERLDRAALVERVRARLAGRADRAVFFDVDDAANYGQVVEVMDGCRGAGASVLGLPTRDAAPR